MQRRTYAEEAVIKLGELKNSEMLTTIPDVLRDSGLDTEASNHVNQGVCFCRALFRDGSYIRRSMGGWEAYRASDSPRVRGVYTQFIATWVPHPGGYWHLSTELFLRARLLTNDRDEELVHIAANVRVENGQITVFWIHPITHERCPSLHDVLFGWPRSQSLEDRERRLYCLELVDALESDFVLEDWVHNIYQDPWLCVHDPDY